jgi:hypothetical protein
VQPPAACRDAVLRHIAMNLADDHQEQAVGLLLRVLGRAMQRASSPYRDELALVGEIVRRMDATRRAPWLAQLRADYKIKRNFVRGLPAR